MGRKIQCPHCSNTFFVHGYEEIEKCYGCDSMINPQRNMVSKDGERYTPR